MNRAVVAYIERGGLLLSIPRPSGEHAAPGGKVELEETWEAGLAREVREETGREIARAWFVHEGHWSGYWVCCYRVELDGEPFAAEPDTRIEWITARDLAAGFASPLHTAGLRAAGLLR